MSEKVFSSGKFRVECLKWFATELYNGAINSVLPFHMELGVTSCSGQLVRICEEKEKEKQALIK